MSERQRETNEGRPETDERRRETNEGRPETDERRRETNDDPSEMNESRLELGAFSTEAGEEIPAFELAYTTYGEFDGSNAVLVCHPLTASHRPAGGDGPFDDWWGEVVGPGRPIDTDEWFVVCVNVPGSPHGSTAPPTPGPDGEPLGSRFPFVTVEDWTRAQRQLLEELGVERLHAVVGGSVGGMNAIEWARRYPDRVERVGAIATGARLDPQCLALDAIARRAITNDPAWQGGDYHRNDHAGDGAAPHEDGDSSDRIQPTDGLAQARRIGHVMYRSKASMGRQFGRQSAVAALAGTEPEATDAGSSDDSVTGGLPAELSERADGPGTYHAVESYLDYNAERFAKQFDAASYLSLLRAMDEYDLSAHTSSDAAALADFDGRLLVVSYTGDWHFTVEDGRRLADAAASAGVETVHRRIDSDYGHDAFLTEQASLVEPLGRLLSADTDRAGSSCDGRRADTSGRPNTTSADSADEPCRVRRAPLRTHPREGWTCR